jgi:hypothetical protein
MAWEGQSLRRIFKLLPGDRLGSSACITSALQKHVIRAAGKAATVEEAELSQGECEQGFLEIPGASAEEKCLEKELVAYIIKE